MKKFLQRLIFPLLVVTCAGALLAQSIGPVPALVNGGRLDRRLGSQAYVTLTNAQVKLLCTTPVTIVPAQGAGTIIVPINGILSYAYTGAYTAVSGNDLKLWYTARTSGPAATATITMLGFLDATANKVINFGGIPADEILAVNAPIVLQNVNGVCFTGGNASNTLTVRLNFFVDNQ